MYASSAPPGGANATDTVLFPGVTLVTDGVPGALSATVELVASAIACAASGASRKPAVCCVFVALVYADTYAEWLEYNELTGTGSAFVVPNRLQNRPGVLPTPDVTWAGTSISG